MSNYNLFHVTGGANIADDGTTATNDLAVWQAGTGLDTNSVQANPKFVSLIPGGEDLHIQSTSPAIDAGTYAGIDTDYDSEARPFSSGYDIGADESQSGGGSTSGPGGTTGGGGGGGGGCGLIGLEALLALFFLGWISRKARP